MVDIPIILTVNQGVVGSSPTWGAMLISKIASILEVFLCPVNCYI